MKLSDRYLSSLSEEGRYRLLVEAVTDYAIYLLDPSGNHHDLESRRATDQGLYRARNHRPALFAVLHRRRSKTRLTGARRADRRARREVRG